MYDDGLVSVMVPVFNAERTILDTLESVWRQAYRPLELIIINDGSTDASGDLATRWCAERQAPQFLAKIDSTSHQGLAAARNRALELSTGAYVQFLDADDILHPEKFTKSVPLLARGGADVVVARTAHFRETGEIVRRLDSPPAVRRWSRRELSRITITRGFWYTMGPVFRRSVVRAVGPFPENVHPVVEELEFHARVKLSRPRVVYLDEVLNFYRKGFSSEQLTGGLARTYEGNIEGVRIALELLRRHDVLDCSEWRSLLEFAARTYYRTVCCAEATCLRDRAWLRLCEVLEAMLPLGWLLRAVPRRVVEPMLRVSWFVRGARPRKG